MSNHLDDQLNQLNQYVFEFVDLIDLIDLTDASINQLNQLNQLHVWDFWLIVISATLNFCSKNQCEKSIIEAASLQYVFRSASVQSRRCQIRAPAM